MRTTEDMLRVLGHAVNDLQGRVEEGKLAVVVQAGDHISEQYRVIQQMKRLLPDDARTFRKIRSDIARLEGDNA